MIYLSTLLAAVLLTALSVPLLSRLAMHYSFVDLPNERKVHSRPVPRIGGLAMALGVFVPVLYWKGGDPFVIAYLAGAFVQVFFGFLDDYFDLPPRWKLVGQCAAACIVIFFGGIRITSLGFLAPEGYLLPTQLAIPLTILTIVGVTNAINLADGLDGLAGGICLLSLCCIGYLSYVEGDGVIGLISLALAAATFGFLRYNTYPATIFMGDAGSQLLGFSAITLALALTQGSTPLSPLLPLIILGFPILDTLTVMTSRIARGRSPFAADKTHFHHSLLGLGLHQTESVLVIYLIQVTLVTLALLFRFHSDWLLLVGYLVFSAGVLLVFSLSRQLAWQPKRMAPIVRIKAYLRLVRDRTPMIRYLFRPLQLGLFLMLVVTASLTRHVSGFLIGVSIGAVILVLVIDRFLPHYLEDCLRAVLYLFIPVFVYYSDFSFHHLQENINHVVNWLFIVLAVMNIAVSKLTKRKQGFKSTPLDFLILFIVAFLLYLPESNLQAYHLGAVGGKIIICYFCCEVVIAESRGNLGFILKTTVVALAILMVQVLRGGM